MSKEQEALKLALRDLENAEIATNSTYESTMLIRETLAQPVQEPVLRDEQGRPMTYWGGKAAPPAAQPAQEQRPWTGLTDEERRTVLFKSDTAEEVAIGIEAKLRRKIMAERRCTFKCGEWHCGSYQFNLYKDDIDQGGFCDVHYWQTKAQRKWVGLTDDELADLWYKESIDWMEFARAHEAALKEKNT